MIVYAGRKWSKSVQTPRLPPISGRTPPALTGYGNAAGMVNPPATWVMPSTAPLPSTKLTLQLVLECFGRLHLCWKGNWKQRRPFCCELFQLPSLDINTVDKRTRSHSYLIQAECSNFRVGFVNLMASIVKPVFRQDHTSRSQVKFPVPSRTLRSSQALSWSLAADTSNSAMMPDHAATGSLLVHLPWLILPNNIRHLFSNVVHHFELDLTCLTTQIPGLNSRGLSC